MKKLKKPLVLLLALSLILSLAACTAPAGNSSAPASSAQSEVTSSKAESSEPASSEPSEEVTALEGALTFWTMWNDTEPQGEAMQEIADKFMETYPGTTIEIQWCGRDISKTLKPALEGGQQIDIFDYPTQYGGQLEQFCADLSEIIKTPYDALDGKTMEEVLLPTMLETPKKQTGITSGQIAVGYKPWLCLFMYNVSAFEEAGVTANPTTWEELDAACAKLKEAGYSPITFDDAYAHWLPGMYLARAKGQDWVHELVADTTGEMWNDEAVVQMANAFEDFASKGYFDENVGGNKWPAGQMDIGSGKVGMYLNLTGLPSELQDVTGEDFKWGAFNYPDVADGQNQVANAAPSGCTMTAINANCENMDLAAEFVAFMRNEDSDAAMVGSGMTTARIDGNWPAALDDVKPVFSEITVVQETGGGVEANADLKPILAENFIKLAAGQITADEFVSNMVAAAKQ